MRINAYRILSLPDAINWSPSKSDKEPPSDSINWCWGKGGGRILAIATPAAFSFAKERAERIDLRKIHTHQRNTLLHQIIDPYFRQLGLKNYKNTFYYPRATASSFPPIFNGDVYINTGFEYKLETIDNINYLVILPKSVYTKDGINYDPEFAKDVHYKFYDNPNVHYKYSRHCELFADLTKNLGETISIDAGTKQSLVLQVAQPLNESAINIIQEPNIDFGGGRTHSYPAAGIKRYHPLDYNLSFPNRPKDIKVAYIGSFFTRDLLNTMFKGEQQGRYPFPGFKNIYKANINTEGRTIELSTEEIKACSSVEDIASLLKQKVLSIKNNGLDIDVCLIELVPEWEDFFIGQAIDLHDYLKVSFWQERIPTQIITRKAVESDSSSTYANIALGIYVTAGGKPWRLEEQFSDTAFIGISFGESKREKKLLIGIAEIFDEYGHSIATTSLTMKEKSLDEKIYDRDKHLSSEQLETIINSLLQHYRDKMNGNVPRSIIIHKTTSFDDNERDVIVSFSETAIEFTLVYVNVGHTNLLRLLKDNKKEPNRGLYWKMTDNKALLYTSGILSNQLSYTLPKAPLPIILHIQNESSLTIDNICKQIILLTKLNWNSVNSYEREPVTLSHSRKLIDLLRAGLDPSDIPMDLRFYL